MTEEREVQLTFRCVEDQFRAAKVELRIIVLPNNLKSAVISAGGALALFVVTLGFTALQKAIFSTEQATSAKHPFRIMYEAGAHLVSYSTSSLGVLLSCTTIFGSLLSHVMDGILDESQGIQGEN